MDRDEGRYVAELCDDPGVSVKMPLVHPAGNGTPSSVVKMHQLLDDAKEIVGGARHQAYGDPTANHACTGEMWTSYLKRRGLLASGAEVTAGDVCWMMCLLKASREAHWSQRDNALDCIGYAANAFACSRT